MSDLPAHMEMFCHDINNMKVARNVMLPDDINDNEFLARVARDIANQYMLVDIAIMVSLGTTMFMNDYGEMEEKSGVVISGHSVCNKSSSIVLEVEDMEVGVPLEFTGNESVNPYNIDDNTLSDIFGVFRGFYFSHLEELRLVMARWNRRRKDMYDPCMN